MITCNDCENEKQFSVEKILEKSSSSKTSKSFPLKFGVEKLLNNDEIKITDRNGPTSLSPLSNSFTLMPIASREIPVYASERDIVTYPSPYMQASYIWQTTSCDRCVISNPIRSESPSLYPILNNSSYTQMLAHMSGYTTKRIAEAMICPASNANLLQHHYNNQFLQPNAADNNIVHGSNQAGKRKRSWSRAVFSNLQRKGLEKRFELQRYITKPDRRQLAASLGLTDAQVKVWFQNRRMKWRHSSSYKEDLAKAIAVKEQTSNKLQDTKES